jgi:hypothetical protein
MILKAKVVMSYGCGSETFCAWYPLKQLNAWTAWKKITSEMDNFYF